MASEKKTKDVVNPCLPVPIPPQVANTVITAMNTATSEIQSLTPVNDVNLIRNRTGITIRNESYIVEALQLAEMNPNTVNSTIDLQEWSQDLVNFDSIQPLIQSAEILLDAANRYSRVAAVSAMNDFSKYYRCVQILANEGLPEAIPIFRQLKTLFAHLRGVRGPNCVVSETNNLLIAANKLLHDNKGKLNSLLSNEKALEHTLKEDIHLQEHILE